MEKNMFDVYEGCCPTPATTSDQRCESIQISAAETSTFPIRSCFALSLGDATNPITEYPTSQWFLEKRNQDEQFVIEVVQDQDQFSVSYTDFAFVSQEVTVHTSKERSGKRVVAKKSQPKQTPFEEEASSEPGSCAKQVIVVNQPLSLLNKAEWQTCEDSYTIATHFGFIGYVLKKVDWERFSKMMDRISLEFFEKSQLLLKVYIECKFQAGQFENVIAMIEQHCFDEKYHAVMQHIWRESHIGLFVQRAKKLPTSIQKFRINQRNPFPMTIWDGVPLHYGIKQTTTDLLLKVFNRNKNPSLQEMKELAQLTGFSFKKVKVWFKNHRYRSKSQF